MPLDLTTLLVGAALLLAAFVKGTTGFGFPLIATPMVALLLDIRTAIAILVIPNIVMDIGQIFRGGFPTPILLDDDFIESVTPERVSGILGRYP